MYVDENMIPPYDRLHAIMKNQEANNQNGMQ